MSRSAALTRARNLREELQAKGLRVSIELQTGRSGGWNAGRFVGVLGHHTVSRRSMGDTPVLGLVKRGRSDLPGPLANGYMGFDLVVRIVTMDWANHPGSGGPLSVPGFVIPASNGRPYLFGYEHEGGLSEADWDHNGGEMREAMGRTHAATLLWLNRDERSYGEHKTWAPGRKIDRLGYSTSSGRAEARRNLTGGSGPINLEETMFCRKGDTGEAVGLLQIQLRELGHYKGDVDQAYGPKTSAAVLAMRRSVGSSADSGDVYNRYGYHQLRKALFNLWSKTLDAGHLRQHERIKALEDIHPHDTAPDGGGGVGLPDEFTAQIRPVR